MVRSEAKARHPADPGIEAATVQSTTITWQGSSNASQEAQSVWAAALRCLHEAPLAKARSNSSSQLHDIWAAFS